MPDDPEELAVKALSFLAADQTQLSRFLETTGWTPEALAQPDSRGALLLAVLDYVMQNEDLLITFAANAGVEPTNIAAAYRRLSGDARTQGT